MDFPPEHPEIEQDDMEYNFQYPFIVCESNGGPYDDVSFVSGVRFGCWMTLLKLMPSQHSEYEPKSLVPQLDLLAMNNGYRMIVNPFDDYWVLVTMRRD